MYVHCNYMYIIQIKETDTLKSGHEYKVLYYACTFLSWLPGEMFTFNMDFCQYSDSRCYITNTNTNRSDNYRLL